MAEEGGWSQSVVASCEGIWVACKRVCFPKSWTRAASPFTEAKFSCLAKGPDEAEDEEQEDEDEVDGGMAESLHSTCLSSALPAVGTGAAVAPEVTVISAAVVMVTVAVLPSFLALADAWQ